MQMICALLVFRTPALPEPLGRLSPWMDWLVEPRDDVWDRLAAQRHRRFVKTHTPLDGLPIDARVMYVVVARHPLDMAASLYHQGDNLDRDRMRELTGAPPAAGDAEVRLPLRDWLRAWIDEDRAPAEALDSLPGVMWHLTDAWSRRGEPNVVLVHYDDLVDDLESQMRRVAGILGIEIEDEVWPALVHAATFDEMRARADVLVPDTLGVLKDRTRFFRRGGSGEGRALLTDAEHARYLARVATMAPPDLLAWVHRDGGL
jgi:hypothetical protein